MRRRLHVEIGDIIAKEPKVLVDGKVEVEACLFALVYNLQRQAKSSDWLLKQLQHDKSAIVQVFPAIKTLQSLVQVR